MIYDKIKEVILSIGIVIYSKEFMVELNPTYGNLYYQLKGS
jgi:hypothetical protein